MEQTQLIEYFENSEVNQKLLKLFESKREAVDKVYNALQEEEEWAVLHLVCVPHNYEKMKYKILIVGQENNGWGYETEPKKSMLFTLEFQSNKFYDNAPFFSFPYSFCESINDCDNEKYSKKSYLAWVNLREFSFETSSRKPLNEKAQNIIDNEFDILEEEIKIINPDIVLFLTGPNYDNYIVNQLKGVEFKTVENYHIRQFARVEHEALPKNSFRIYHPNRIRFIKEGYKKYLESLKKECGL